MTVKPCAFCDLTQTDLIAEAGPCAAIWTNQSPAGSLMVIPKAHRETPWDLTPEEWSVTKDLLHAMMKRVQQSHQPDGWNVGWNVGQVGGQSVSHAHCHLVPRYREERYAGKGLRWWFKQPENAFSPSAGTALADNKREHALLLQRTDLIEPDSA